MTQKRIGPATRNVAGPAMTRALFNQARPPPPRRAAWGGRQMSAPAALDRRAKKADLSLPSRPPHRLSAAAQAAYDSALAAWCRGVKELAASLGFRVSSRGWCYVLEEHGLLKGDFDAAQKLINECRKSGLLPLDICSH